MKSIQVNMYEPPDEVDRYSELKVLLPPSGYGYYIGTTYTTENGSVEPGSRDSGYFKTREEAEAMLKQWEAGDIDGIRLDP